MSNQQNKPNRLSDNALFALITVVGMLMGLMWGCTPSRHFRHHHHYSKYEAPSKVYRKRGF